jgi:hypothetical protein
MIVGLTVHILLAIAVMASAVTSPAHAQDNANAMAICSSTKQRPLPGLRSRKPPGIL